MKTYGLSPGPLNAGKELPNILDQLKSLGAKSVRAGLTRKGFDNGNGTYETGMVTTIAAELDKRGMTWLAGMTTGGGVAFDNIPGSAKAFGELARVLGNCPNVVGMQTENEPEHLKSDLHPTPARWVDYQKQVYAAAKKAAPNLLVVTGGLGGMEADWSPGKNCADFLAASYELGLRGYFDVLAEHPYCAPYTIRESIKAGRKGGWLLRECHRIMVAYGDRDKKIICSEHGLPNGSPPTGGTVNMNSEEFAVRWMQDAHSYFEAHDWVHSAYWFTSQDHAVAEKDDSGDYMGLIRADGSRKKVADTFLQLQAA